MYLYKYRCFSESHLNALSKNELWFSVGENFNDPLDCTVNVPVSFVDYDEYHKLVMERTRAVEYIEHGIINEQDIERIIMKELGRAEKMMQDGTYQQHEIGFLVDRTFNLLVRSFVCCLAQRSNNHLMWSHYSDGHTGFCIRYVKEHLLNNSKIYLHGKVNYDGKPVTILSHLLKDSPRDAESRVIFKKSPEWSYEEEYRLIHQDLSNGREDVSKVLPYEDDAIDCIIFGMRATSSDIDNLKRRLSGRNIKFKKIERAKAGFELYATPE